MKRMKILALMMIIIGVSQTLFSQNLYIGSQDVTNDIYYVRAGTQPLVEVVASLGTATNTQWLSLDTAGIVPITPALDFSFTGASYGHRATFQLKGPAGKLYVRFLMSDGSIEMDSIMFVYTVFPTTDLRDTTVSGCQNSVETFHATETTNTEYVYNWQYRTNGTASWLTVEDLIGDNMPIQFIDNTGYQYRCIVSLSSCETCLDTTGIITVEGIYPLPDNQVLIINGTSTNSNVTIERGICVDPTSVGLQNTQNETTCRLENVNGTLLQALPGTGGPITFSSTLVSGQEYRIAIVSDNGCSTTVKKR